MLNVDRVEEADPGSGGEISAKIPPRHTGDVPFGPGTAMAF